MSCLNKKGSEALAATIGALIIIFIGALLIIPLFPDILHAAEDSLKDEACRANIGIRKYEIEASVNLGIDIKLATLRAPLKGCVTVDKKEVPKKGDSEELVKKSIADLMRDCWQRYSEGVIGDVFKEGSPWINNCQTCYIFKVKKDAKIQGGKISIDEFYQYLSTTPYKPKDTTSSCFTYGKDRGGFCANSKDECTRYIKTGLGNIEFDEKNNRCIKARDSKGDGCCYSNIDCLNNGGECSKGPLGSDHSVYPSWKCPKGETCYIKKENDLTYLTYFQRGKGPGSLYLLTDITPNEIYAVSFGAPTNECSTTLCKAASIGTGVIIGIGVAAVIIYSAPVSIPASIIGLIAGGTGFLAGKFAGQSATAVNVKLADYFTERSTSAIYLSTLDQIRGKSITGQGEPLCTIIPE